MALKGDRHILYDDIRYFCNDKTERGVFLVHSGSGGNGVSMDNTDYLVTLPTGSVSGLRVAGLLMNDFVDIDETRFHLNKHKDEERVGGKAHLLKKGWVYTNKIKSGDNPTAGVPAYLVTNGECSVTQESGAPRVGTFKGTKDSNGYVLLEVDVD